MNFSDFNQCNTKNFYIQKTLNAYNSKWYSNILKAACKSMILYLIMKDCIFVMIYKLKFKVNSKLIKCKKKKINIMDYTISDYKICYFSKVGVKNGWKNLLKIFIFHILSFI